MPKLITSFYSTRFSRYIEIDEKNINRAVANSISRVIGRESKVEHHFKIEIQHNYTKRVYYVKFDIPEMWRRMINKEKAIKIKTPFCNDTVTEINY